MTPTIYLPGAISDIPAVERHFKGSAASVVLNETLLRGDELTRLCIGCPLPLFSSEKRSISLGVAVVVFSDRTSIITFPLLVPPPCAQAVVTKK